jgi:uncharacterized transporter YbjL
MALVLLWMVLGIVIGIFLSNFPRLLKINENLLNVSIYALLLILGISIGSNKNITSHFYSLGVQALVIALGAIGGSVLVSWIIYRLFFYIK